MNDNIKSYTHIALVLDASGSMSGLRDATIASLKKFFASQKSPEDKTVIDLWQFDDRVRHLIDGEDIEKGAGQAIENYTIGGCTALHDAICIGIDELGAKFANMREEDRPDAVVFAILTDGFENASRTYTLKDVKSRIRHQSEKYSWEFRFLAANQDAVLTGGEMGLGAGNCNVMVQSAEGMAAAAMGLAAACCVSRQFARKNRSARQAKR